MVLSQGLLGLLGDLLSMTLERPPHKQEMTQEISVRELFFTIIYSFLTLLVHIVAEVGRVLGREFFPAPCLVSQGHSQILHTLAMGVTMSWIIVLFSKLISISLSSSLLFILPKLNS